MGITKPKPTKFPGKVKKTKKEVVTEPELTDKQVEWLRKYYPTASVKELLSAMNVSPAALYKMRDKYGLKRDSDFRRQLNIEANKKMLESIKENGRLSCSRPDSVHVRTKQKGPFVVIATKVCKDDYDKFTNLVTLQGLTKHEVIRTLVKNYILNTKVSRTKLTKEQIEQLRIRYVNTEDEVLAREFCVPCYVIKSYAIRLGLKKPSPYPPNQGRNKLKKGRLPSRIETLMRKHFATTNNLLLARHLGVNDNTVRRWARLLGLKKCRNKKINKTK